MLQSDLKGVALSHNALLPHHQFSTLTLGGGTRRHAWQTHSTSFCRPVSYVLLPASVNCQVYSGSQTSRQHSPYLRSQVSAHLQPWQWNLHLGHNMNVISTIFDNDILFLGLDQLDTAELLQNGKTFNFTLQALTFTVYLYGTQFYRSCGIKYFTPLLSHLVYHFQNIAMSVESMYHSTYCQPCVLGS